MKRNAMLRVAPSNWRRGKAAALAIGASGLLLTMLAMIVASIPPSDTAEPWVFRLKVIGGAALFVLLGGAVYWRARLVAARLGRG